MTPVDARLYYATPTTAPIVVEIIGGFVAEVGEEGWRPIRSYPGRFVKLVEATLPASVPGATSGAVAREEVL